MLTNQIKSRNSTNVWGLSMFDTLLITPRINCNFMKSFIYKYIYKPPRIFKNISSNSFYKHPTLCVPQTDKNNMGDSFDYLVSNS